MKAMPGAIKSTMPIKWKPCLVYYKEYNADQMKAMPGTIKSTMPIKCKPCLVLYRVQCRSNESHAWCYKEYNADQMKVMPGIL